MYKWGYYIMKRNTISTKVKMCKSCGQPEKNEARYRCLNCGARFE